MVRRMSPRKLLGCVVALALALAVRTGARAASILYLSTLVSPSHQIWDRTLLAALRDRGHRSTVLSHVPDAMDNVTVIHLEGVADESARRFEPGAMSQANTLESIKDMFAWRYELCRMDLETDGFRALHRQVRDGLRFDLVLMDMMAGQCMYPMVQALGCPVIGTSPFGMMPQFSVLFGTGDHSSIVPFYRFTYTNRMTFFERTNSYIHNMFYLFWWKHMYNPSQERLAERYFKDVVGSLDEFERNISLVLVNYDPVLNYPQPLPPSIIPVGGLHAQRAKDLPKDIQNYLDNSHEGAIYFSLGSNVRSDDLSLDQKRVLLKTFERLKENVLWKYETKMDNVPKNVIIRKWFPQNDILGHENVKLFITHGGAHSSHEAMYHGVPIVGVPIFADQYTNVGRMVWKKLGKMLHINDNFTAETVYGAIREVIDDPTYKENAAGLSRRYRDQAVSPLDRAVFWVEHVLRHGPAEHLSLPSRDMYGFQATHLDSWCALLAVLLLCYLLALKTCVRYTAVKKVKAN